MSAVTTATVLTAASIAATVGSTAMSMIGQSQQASAQAGMASYQSEIARRNAQIMEWNARRAEQEGRIAEDQQRQKTSLIQGAQRAALASQGGDVNEGSNLDILGDTERAGEFDALTLRSNAALKAYGYRLQGAGGEAQAGLYDLSAANATANLPFALGSTLLAGASSVAGKWKGFSDRPGTPGGAGD
jgi:hypothetical protein